MAFVGRRQQNAPTPGDDQRDEDVGDILAEAKKAFKVAEESEADNRSKWEEDLRFSRLGEQWDQQTVSQREDDMRPALTINKMNKFIRGVVNEARRKRSGINVKPVDSVADPETAEVMNGLIRNIEHISNAAAAYDTGIDYSTSMGIGYWRINVEYAYDDVFDQDILIERIANPFSVYGDPYDQGVTSEHWNSCFITEHVPRDEFRRRYRNNEEVDWEAEGYVRQGTPWFSEHSVLVAEWFKREEKPTTIYLMSDGTVVNEEVLENEEKLLYFAANGIVPVRERPSKTYEVTHRVLTGVEVLETIDWPGRYIPVVPVYGEDINVQGKRHIRSLIRDAKDPQRMKNYWRTATTEMVALAPKNPWLGEEAVFEGKDKHRWADANRSNYSYLSYPKGVEPPQRMPLGTDLPAGAWAEANAADEDISDILGQSIRERDYERQRSLIRAADSGAALMRKERESETQTFHFQDNQDRAIAHTGKILLDLIPHVYAGPRIIRVLGPDDEEKACQLGAPGCERMQGQRSPEGVYDLQGVYDLTAGKYDLVSKAGPSYATQREEAADQMFQLIRAYPQAAPIIGDLLVKNLDWPGAQEIAERLKSVNPALQQDDDPRLAMMAQYIEGLEGQIAELSSDRQADLAKAVNDFLKTRIDAYDAESKRIDSLTKAGEAIVSAVSPPGPYDPFERGNGQG